MNLILSFDNMVLDFLQSIHTPLLNSFFITITKAGDAGIIWIAISVLLLFFEKTRKAGLCSLIALILSLICGNLILKNLIARDRPFFQAVAEFEYLISYPSGYSFPSGHTLSSFAAATAISRVMKSKWFTIPLMTLAALIGLSRLYLYVHFPTDVIAGAILGVLLGFLAIYIFARLQKAADKRLENGI